jgi:hypothetical protein
VTHLSDWLTELNVSQDHFKHLTGQLLFPTLQPHVLVTVSVMPLNFRREKGALMRFRNQLNADNAHSLVHLLRHLEGCAALTGNVSFYGVKRSNEAEKKALGPAFVAMLQNHCGIGKLLVGKGHTGSGQLDEAEMSVLAGLTHVKTFHARTWVIGDLLVPSSHANTQPPVVNEDFVDYVLTAGSYCTALMLEVTTGSPTESVQLGDFFDAFVEVGFPTQPYSAL